MNAMKQRVMPLDAITLDQRLQPRVRIDEATWSDYTEALQDGIRLPPVVVFSDGETHWLADGFHRWHAHKAADIEVIAVDVRQGTWESALSFALGANAEHGKRREPGDYRHAYTRAVQHQLVIAVDPATVVVALKCSLRWAYDLTAPAREAAERERDAAIVAKKADGKSNREISREVGVSVGTVSNKTSADQKLHTAKTDHLRAEPLPTHPAQQEFDDLTSPRGQAWGAVFDALLAIEKLPDIDGLFADRYSRLDHALGPALEHAHAWIGELHRRFFA